jgi:protein-disulfide isomerase
VTVVVFFDLEDSFSREGLELLSQIQASSSPDELRIVWKSRPLSVHASAELAHEVAMAVYRLRKAEAFVEFQRAALAEQGALHKENLLLWASQAGASKREVEGLLRTGEAAQMVEKDTAEAKKLNVLSTPAFFINGLRISGVPSKERLLAAIEGERAETAKLIETGAAPEEVYARRVVANFH